MAPHLSHLCSFQVHLIPRLPSKLLVAQDKAWQPSVSTSASGSSICTCFLFTHPLPFDLELNFSPLIATLSTDGPEPTPSQSQACAPHFHMYPLLLSHPPITKLPWVVVIGPIGSLLSFISKDGEKRKAK